MSEYIVDKFEFGGNLYKLQDNTSGYTKNIGTVTGIKMNNSTLSPTSGIVNIGTVITSHQDISGKADKATTLAGYGITDAKIANGVITLGSNTITPLTSHQDISGKADKSATVSTVTYDSTNKKLTKTINGTTTDVVTVATLKTALGSMPASDVYGWAKASTKPTYTAAEVGALPSSTSIPDAISELDNDVRMVVADSGTANGYLAKFVNANTIANGPRFGDSTATFLRNDGIWASPPQVPYSLEILSVSSEFVLANTSEPITLKQYGEVVSITGIVNPKSDIAGATTRHNICTMDSKYAPGKEIHLVMHGSGNAEWLLSILTTGAIQFSRYRNTGTAANSYITANTSQWLPFHATWIL